MCIYIYYYARRFFLHSGSYCSLVSKYRTPPTSWCGELLTFPVGGEHIHDICLEVFGCSLLFEATEGESSTSHSKVKDTGDK